LAGAGDVEAELGELFFLVWCFLWLCFTVLAGAEAAGAWAKTRLEVAATKNNANTIAITFFILFLL
jgi:hypothetical protein